MPSQREPYDPHEPSGLDDSGASEPTSAAEKDRTGPYEARAAPAGVEPPEPPRAPDIDRRVRFHAGQLIGLLMIAAVPIMGLAGVFGTSPTVRVAQDDLVSVSVTYPRVQRFKVRDRLSILVTNTGTAELTSVELRVSNAFLLSFSDVTLTPSPDRIDETDHVFVVTALQPGQTSAIVAEMQADDYWISRGTVTWSTSGQDPQETRSGQLAIWTLTWP